MLQIQKRDGSLVSNNPNKILNRIKKASKGLKVNTDEIFIKVITSVPTEGIITTEQLDELIANTAAPYTGTHYDYSSLAAKVSLGSYYKSTNPSVYKTFLDLNKQGIIDDILINKIEKYGIEKVENLIKEENDEKFNFFAWKALQNTYLLKNSNGKLVERPQYMYLRIALWLTNTFEECEDTYNELSKQLISYATPIMINSGTTNAQLSSCVLIQNYGDSRQSLLDTLNDVCKYSSDAAGIGLAMSNIRSKKSKISTSGGDAGGLLKYLKIINEGLRFFNQQGKRPGAAAIYLEPWHKDIFDLLEIKKQTGKDEARARDIFTAIWASDSFMKAVKEDTDWYLFCPNDILKAGLKPLYTIYGEEFEIEYNKAVELGLGEKVRAQEVWSKIIESQMETGVPYIAYKDHANRKTNHKMYGTIKQSNLCVAPETLLLTDIGYKEIQHLTGQKINVWNGFEWSEVEPFKTNDIAELYTVILSDGSELDCTDYHKWFINTNYKGKQEIKRTFELKAGDRLIKHDFPIINDGKDMKYSYTHGLFCADGGYAQGNPQIQLYDKKRSLVPYLDIRNKYSGSPKNVELNEIAIRESEEKIVVQLNFDIKEKFYVPFDYNIKSKLEWLAGYLDGDGCIALNNQNGYYNQSIQVASVNKSFLRDIKLMLSTMGIKSNISLFKNEGDYMLPNGKDDNSLYNCKTTYRLTISSWYTHKLLELGLNCHRLEISNQLPNREAGKYITVVEVKNTGRKDSTYCFTEPKNNSAIFNGVLTGQCIEIMEYTDEETIATCNLASVVLKNYVENKKFNFELLRLSIHKIVKGLNEVININHYSAIKGKKGALEQRAIAIGVQGLADVFFLMDYIFTSDEAKDLNRKISETIYFAAIEESCRLSKENIYPKYHLFEESPIAKGIFQFDMWGVSQDDLSGMYDWKTLKENVAKYGICNSLVTGQMPVAGSAKITESYESTEPMDSNLFNRRVLGGNFLIGNKYLIQDLEKLGIWNEQFKNDIINNDGSIQNIDFLNYLDSEDKNYEKKIKRIEYLLLKYKSVWEISQKELIDMAADRGIFIDQSQSMNIYFAKPTVGKISSSHNYAFEKGLKTGCYYLRSKPISTGAKHLAIEQKELIEKPITLTQNNETNQNESPFDCFGCSA